MEEEEPLEDLLAARGVPRPGKLVSRQECPLTMAMARIEISSEDLVVVLSLVRICAVWQPGIASGGAVAAQEKVRRSRSPPGAPEVAGCGAPVLMAP